MRHLFELRKNFILISLYVILSLSTLFYLNYIIQTFTQNLIIEQHQSHAHLVQSQYQELLLRRASESDIYIQIALLSSTLNLDTYVTDDKGKIIYTSTKNNDLIGTYIPHTIISDALLLKRKTMVDSIDLLFEDKRILSASPIMDGRNVSGTILSITKFDDYLVDHEIYIYFTLGLVLFILLLHALHKKFLFSRTSSLILDLNTAVKRIAKGDFTSHIETDDRGPVGDLARNMVDMIEKLEEYEGNRTDYISNISHDFRTPLTSIKGFVEAMQDGTIPPNSYDYYLNIIHEEAERLTALTSELLVLNSVESTSHKLDLVKFNIETVIKKAFIQFEITLAEKSLNIQFNFTNEAKCVYGDLNQIHRVIYNILDNAIKFTESGGSIEIKTILHNERVYVSISDTGEGIPPDDIPYIYSRFYKGDKSRGKNKSSGIGLAVVKEIMDAHHQEITVNSELHVGTTFTFTLNHYPC